MCEVFVRGRQRLSPDVTSGGHAQERKLSLCRRYSMVFGIRMIHTSHVIQPAHAKLLLLQ